MRTRLPSSFSVVTTTNSDGESRRYPDNRPLRLSALYRGRPDAMETAGRGHLVQDVNWGYFRGHIHGHLDLRIYPLRDDGTCAFATVRVRPDVDRVLQLQGLLKDYGIDSIVVRPTKELFDVTVFIDGWARAEEIRLVFRALTQEARLPRAVVTPSIQRPQDGHRRGGSVELPYLAAVPKPSANGRGSVQPDSGCRIAVDLQRQCDLTLDEFLETASSKRVKPATVNTAAAALSLPSDLAATVNADGIRSVNAPNTLPDRYLAAIHRAMLELGLQRYRLAWPVVVELYFRTNRETGWSRATPASLLARLGGSRATLYRLGIGPLLHAGIVEASEQTHRGGQFSRVVYRLALVGGRGRLSQPASPDEQRTEEVDSTSDAARHRDATPRPSRGTPVWKKKRCVRA
jgi:hypothetical protein